MTRGETAGRLPTCNTTTARTGSTHALPLEHKLNKHNTTTHHNNTTITRQQNNTTTTPHQCPKTSTELVPSTHQIKGMHTIIRDAATPMQDFTFYADRLNRLIVEAGLGHLPFAEKTVVTPTGAPMTMMMVAIALRCCPFLLLPLLAAAAARLGGCFAAALARCAFACAPRARARGHVEAPAQQNDGPPNQFVSATFKPIPNEHSHQYKSTQIKHNIHKQTKYRPPLRRRRVLLGALRRQRRALGRVDGDGAARVLPG